jgi:hypothetical protein
MKSLTRLLARVCVVLLPLAVSGCITEKLYDTEFSSYTDSFSSVLVSADKKTLVVITDKYHYIFPAPSSLVGILHTPEQEKINATIYSFRLNTDHVLEGNIELCLPDDSSKPAIDKVTQLGFHHTGKYRGYCAATTLKGARYRSGDIPVSDSYKLKKSYQVEVHVDANALERGTKIALTPITAAADGTLIVAGSPLLAIYLLTLMNSETWAH